MKTPGEDEPLGNDPATALREVLELFKAHLATTSSGTLQGEITHLRDTLRQRDEGIAWLKGEIAARESVLRELREKNCQLTDQLGKLPSPGDKPV